MKKISLILLFLIFIPYSYAIEEIQPILNSLGTSKNWLNSLNKKNLNTIKETLGNASSEKTWDYNGKKEPLLIYEYPAQNLEVSLYFYKDSVVNASIHQQSD